MNVHAAEPDTAVIDFSTQTGAARKRRPNPVRSVHPDADLIETCIEVASHIAAGAAAFVVDPTDSDFANGADTRAQARAMRNLSKLYEMEADSFDGLRAKAELIPILLKDWNGHFDEIGQKFLISIADDVRRLQHHMSARRQSDISLMKTDLVHAEAR
jgi:hypothetical protein